MAVPKRLQYTLTLTPLKSRIPSQPRSSTYAADILTTSSTEQAMCEIQKTVFCFWNLNCVDF